MYVAIFAGPNVYSNWFYGNNLNVYQGLWASPLVLISGFNAQEASVSRYFTEKGLKTLDFAMSSWPQKAAMLDILLRPDEC